MPETPTVRVPVEVVFVPMGDGVCRLAARTRAFLEVPTAANREALESELGLCEEAIRAWHA